MKPTKHQMGVLRRLVRRGSGELKRSGKAYYLNGQLVQRQTIEALLEAKLLTKRLRPTKAALALVSPPPSTPVVDVPLGDIAPSPYNPRPADAGLEASIRDIGVQQAIKVRPTPAGAKPYEVVFGHRRLVGSQAAGLETIPAVVEELSDAEAMALCAAENRQRADLAPLEEADWFSRLLEATGATLESVGAMVGLSASAVCRRARLRALSPAWREAIAEPGSYLRELGPGHLEVIAALAPEVQDDLLQHDWLFGGGPGNSLPTLGDLRAAAAERLRCLDQAPWDLDDAHLVPDRPCNGCMERSDSQGQLALLGDVLEDQRDRPHCLDKSCWARKAAAHLGARHKELRDRHPGLVILTRGHASSVPESLADAKRGAASSYEEAEPGAEGAVPTMAADTGELSWHRPLSWAPPPEASPAPAPKESETPEEELARRLEDLEGKRRQVFADLVREVLSESLEPDGLIDRLPDIPKLAALCLAVGTQHRRDCCWITGTDATGAERRPAWTVYNSALMDVWGWVDGGPNVQGLGELAFRRALWREVGPVLVRRLRDEPEPEYRVAIYRDARRVGEVLGLNLEDYWQRACEARPKGRALAKLEERLR